MHAMRPPKNGLGGAEERSVPENTSPVGVHCSCLCVHARANVRMCEGALMHRAAVEERLWERQRTLGV